MQKSAWSGLVLLTLGGLLVVPVVSAQVLEPLFRAGLAVSTTFKDNPVATTVQPLKIEIEVAKTKATTMQEKDIVRAYTLAMLDLSTVALSYEFALKTATATAESEAKTAAMKETMKRDLMPGAPRPGTRAAAEQEKKDKEALAEAIALATRTATLKLLEQSTPQIEAALKRLGDAQALYAASSTTGKSPAKPAAKP